MKPAFRARGPRPQACSAAPASWWPPAPGERYGLGSAFAVRLVVSAHPGGGVDCVGCMPPLCRFKGAALIARLAHPHPQQNPSPGMRPRAYRDRVTLALGALAVGGVLGPWLRKRRWPGTLIQGVAPGFKAGTAGMGTGGVATVIGHRGRACQGLHIPPAEIARSVVPPFSQQPGGQSLPRAGQTGKDRAVGVRQKRAALSSS